MNREKLIIQDLDPSLDDGIFFYAGPKTVRCKGCFECWLNIPGRCCMADRSETIGSRIAVTEKVILVSRSSYGGFAAPVKRVLDRSIPGVLPFFRWIHGRMHHLPRYRSQPEMEIHFYAAGELTQKEQTLAEKAARAMAINFNASRVSVTFWDTLPDLKEF